MPAVRVKSWLDLLPTDIASDRDSRTIETRSPQMWTGAAAAMQGGYDHGWTQESRSGRDDQGGDLATGAIGQDHGGVVAGFVETDAALADPPRSDAALEQAGP